MISKLSFGVFLFIFFSQHQVHAGAEFEKDEGIFILTEKNYDEAIKNFEYILVEFYAPWCGHCKALDPEYVKAAQMLREKDSPIKLVSGYPTLRFYREGEEPIKYNGGRMASEIVAWLEKKIGPPAIFLNTAEEAEFFVEDNDVAVIGFYKDKESKNAKKYISAVRDYEVYPMAFTSDEKIFEKYKVNDETVVLFKKFDEGKAVYEGPIDKDVLLEFVERYALPLVIDFNHETSQKIFKGLVKSHLLFFVSKKSPEFEDVSIDIRTLAEEYRHHLMFVIVNTDEDDNRRVIDYLGLKKDKMPTMRIIQMKDEIWKFKPDDTTVAKDNIQKFIDEYLEGKILRDYKTEDLPSDWNAKHVKYLTAKNFDDVAFDKTKDVLVEFYAPWCGHCKKLAPIWDEVGESLADKDNVVVAKIDATLNEMSHTQIQSYPTIRLYKKDDDSDEYIDYNGERTKEGILKIFVNRWDLRSGCT
ncbi:PDIA1 [Lepeophtheirus salmonis]|uniref:Protein disulfide-isomerase n=1 Tax=Lepeophtheirus salmonis TaxID=72036 RepID=A0A7R8CRB2_LEPSM|nr:PDIA1 [Lepeophtheirus salmonis]CAF2901162.1 PDIA1 [Lepeophtheirus salmonis]